MLWNALNDVRNVRVGEPSLVLLPPWNCMKRSIRGGNVGCVLLNLAQGWRRVGEGWDCLAWGRVGGDAAPPTTFPPSPLLLFIFNHMKNQKRYWTVHSNRAMRVYEFSFNVTSLRHLTPFVSWTVLRRTIQRFINNKIPESDKIAFLKNVNCRILVR